MTHGGKGMLTMMAMLYNWIWKTEYAPRRWREGVVVTLFKKGDKYGPENYRGVTLKYMGKRNERPNVGGVSTRSKNRAPSRTECVVNGQMTKAIALMNHCLPLLMHLRSPLPRVDFLLEFFFEWFLGCGNS